MEKEHYLLHDFQRQEGKGWNRVLPFILVKPKELERPSFEVTCRPIQPDFPTITGESHGRLTLSSAEFTLQMMAPLNRLVGAPLNDSFVGKGNLTLQQKTSKGWKLLHRSAV